MRTKVVMVTLVTVVTMETGTSCFAAASPYSWWLRLKEMSALNSHLDVANTFA